ncbi:MAG: hypothetical protein NT076_05575 [Candidatus Pacearchaeota archaeon]|nr:hypothetical protein [Candidatus Pacearchaeota archaeon]
MNSRLILYMGIILTLVLGVYAAESSMQASVQVLAQECTKFSKSINIHDADGDLIQISGYGEICNSNWTAFKEGDNIGRINSTSTKFSLTNKGGGNAKTTIYGNIETVSGASITFSGDTEFISSVINTGYLSSFSMKNDFYGELTINADIGKASVGSVFGKFNTNGNYLSSFSSKGDFSGNLNSDVAKFSSGNVINSQIKSAPSFSAKGDVTYSAIGDTDKFSANNVINSQIKSAPSFSLKRDMVNSNLGSTDKFSVKGKVENCVIGEITNNLASFSATTLNNSYIYANNLGKFSATYAYNLNLLATTISSFSVKSVLEGSKVSSFNQFYVTALGIKKKLITKTETIGTNLFEIL